jgi:hypothetical protein
VHLPSFPFLSPFLSLWSSFFPLEVAVGDEGEQVQSRSLYSIRSLVAGSRKHTAGTGCLSHRGM